MSILINLFGPSTAGKSTTANILNNTLDDLSTVDFDVIKRQIPDYDWRQHAQIGRDMTLDTLRNNVTTRSHILLLMPSPKSQEEFNLIHSIAETHDYKLLNIEITAPNEVLIKRYAERLATIDPTKKNWKFKTLTEFKKKLQKPYFTPSNTITFDSSHISSEDIVSDIITIIDK